jgi:hypothetical protein
MDSAIAWTVVLVVFVLVFDQVLTAFERHLVHGKSASARAP